MIHAFARSRVLAAVVAGLFVSAAWLAGTGCGKAEDQPPATRVERDLGVVAPGFESDLEVELPARTADRRLKGLATSCGCLDVRMWLDGARLETSQVIPGARSPRLRLRFAAASLPRTASGKETTRVTFAESAEPPVEVHVSYRLDPTRSLLVAPGPLAAEYVAPVEKTELVVKLKTHVDPSAIALEEVGDDRGWLTLSPEHAAGQEVCLLIAGLMADGRYAGKLVFRLDGSSREVVPIQVDVRPPAGYECRPHRLAIGLPRGGQAVYPVALAGKGVAAGALAVDWKVAPVITNADAESESGTTVAPELSLVPAGRADGQLDTAQLEFHVNGVASKGVFRGRAFLRPFAEAPFRLTLPYTIRVY